MYTKIHGSHLGLVTNYREGGYKMGAGGGGGIVKFYSCEKGDGLARWPL